MTNRMVLGQVQGRQLLRITPPGVDAFNLASRCTFSSDGDYLKVHHVIDSDVAFHGGNQQNYAQGWTFPALGYIPFGFISISHRNTNRIFYPNDRYPATAEFSNYWGWMLQDGKVFVWRDNPPSSPGYLGTYFVRIIVFKNRADSFIGFTPP